MRLLPLSFQIKHIGDFLHTLPALGFMRAARPGHQAGLVVTPKIAELAEAHPWVDEVFILDRSRGLGHLRSLAADIKKRGYESGLIFDGQPRSILAAFLAGLKNRSGASGLYPVQGWPRFFYNADLDIVSGLDRPLPLVSQAERGLRLAAAALGLEPSPPPRPPKPFLGPEHLARADGLIGELDGPGPLVGLTLQGLQPEKSWPLANFKILVKKLRDEFQARLFVTGGPGESAAAEALARSAGVPVGNFCGRTGLLDLLALAERSDLFITVDTGTSHLAALTETPLISLFIWTSPALWPPQSPLARILCYDWALARFGLRPGDGPWRSAPVIGPEMVFEEAASFLAASEK